VSVCQYVGICVGGGGGGVCVCVKYIQGSIRVEKVILYISTTWRMNVGEVVNLLKHQDPSHWDCVFFFEVEKVYGSRFPYPKMSQNHVRRNFDYTFMDPCPKS